MIYYYMCGWDDDEVIENFDTKSTHKEMICY